MLDYVGILDEFFDGLTPVEIDSFSRDELREMATQLTREEGWEDLSEFD